MPTPDVKPQEEVIVLHGATTATSEGNIGPTVIQVEPQLENSVLPIADAIADVIIKKLNS